MIEAPDWSLRELGVADAGEVQALMEACADYFVLCFGQPPEPGEALRELEVLPEGALPEQKRSLGIVDVDGRGLLGMLDEVADWPRAGTLMLGLVLLRPEVRGRGLASAVLDEREAEWRERGIERVRVGVVRANEGSLRFFARRGFAEVSRVHRDDVADPYEIVVMEWGL